MTGKTVESATDQRQELFEIAEAIAPTWERRRGFIAEVSAPVRPWLVDEVRPRPGATLLELAAGIGDTGFEAARALGGDGRLISTDLSPRMLEGARRRAGELGIENVEFRPMDAQRLELPDASVDGVLCQFGVMLMADPAAALAEARRVLRDGGRLAVAVWAAPDRNPFFALLGALLVQAGYLPPPDPAAPGPFRLADPARLRGLIEQAGFADVRVEEVAVRFVVGDAAEYLAIAADTAGPLAIALRQASADARAAIERQLAEAIAPFADGDRHVMPGLALCAAGSAR